MPQWIIWLVIGVWFAREILFTVEREQWIRERSKLLDRIQPSEAPILNESWSIGTNTTTSSDSWGSGRVDVDAGF